MKTTKITSIIIFLTGIIMLSSCSNNFKNVPAGFVAKELTPTGWSNEIYEAGQVDIGTKNENGSFTSLVLLECTSKTVKEQFMGSESNPDKQDHRVLTKNKTAIETDVYIQIAVPTDPKRRNQIFSELTPVPVTDEERVSAIYLEDVYKNIVQQQIRGKIRDVFSRYENFDSANANRERIGSEIAKAVQDVAQQTKAPFDIVSVSLSNIKEDASVVDAQNQLIAAQAQVEAIKKIGDAIKQNPQYLESRKLDVLEKIGENSKSNLIIMDAGNNKGIVVSTPSSN